MYIHSIHQLIILLLAFVHSASCQLHFAFYNQSLFANLQRQWGDRGLHTLINLHSLTGSHHAIPDCHGQFAQIRNDLPWGHTFKDGKKVDENDFGSDFAFWRTPGENKTVLWPDFDYDGWTFAWTPPLSLVADQFSQVMIKWDKRAPHVFFTGKLSGRKGHIRDRFRICSESHPDLFRADITNWGQLRQHEALHRNLTDQTVTSSQQRLLPWLKPIAGDLRRYVNYKFLIYLEGNTWSTSLKRLLVAGAVVLLPRPDPHESFTLHRMMEGCPDCFIFYNYTELSNGNCSSLIDVLSQHNESHLKGVGERLSSHMTSFLKDRSKLNRLQLDALSQASRQNPLPSDRLRLHNGTLEISGRGLEHITCSRIKTMLREKVGRLLDWQVDLWFDEQCRVRATAPYLSSVAI
jgi:hypothetical protein